MTDRSSVLIVRDDGVIPLHDATPWPTSLATTVEQLLDTLLGPRHQTRQQPRQSPTIDQTFEPVRPAE